MLPPSTCRSVQYPLPQTPALAFHLAGARPFQNHHQTGGLLITGQRARLQRLLRPRTCTNSNKTQNMTSSMYFSSVEPEYTRRNTYDGEKKNLCTHLIFFFCTNTDSFHSTFQQTFKRFSCFLVTVEYLPCFRSSSK